VPPGTLVSKRWSFDFWVVGLYTLLWLVPLTAALGISERREPWRLTLHNVVTLVLLLWLAAVFIVGCVDWASANSADASNFYNRANDPRWCCVYFNLPGAPCVNTVACTPGVAIGELVTDPSFLFQVWMTFVFIALLLVDVILMRCLVRPSMNGGDDEFNENETPLVESRATAGGGGRALPYRGRVRV